MSDTFLSILPEAARHPLLGGDQGFLAITPTATSGLNTQVVASDIVDSSGAVTYTGWNSYCYSSATATVISGQSRRVQSVDLSTGTLTMNRAYSRVTDVSDLFWLLRNFTRNSWRDMANDCLREMKRRVIITTVGLGSNVLRYSAPTGVARPEDVIDIGYRAYPEVTSEGQPIQVPWYSWEDNDGSLTLLLKQDIALTQELVFYVLRPFGAYGANVFSADSDTTTAPRDWLVAEMVARALTTLWSRAPEGEKKEFAPRLQAAGLLCAGFRQKYSSGGSQRRMMQPDSRF